MTLRKTVLRLLLAAAPLVFAVAAQAITIQTVPVGNVGNVADSLTGRGAVAYNYNVGKYEVTNEQYIAMLNGIGQTRAEDPILLLYNPYIASTGINVSGGVYSCDESIKNYPVAYVRWHDMIRFANWMTNGQGSADTETGVYTLSDPVASFDSYLWTVTIPDATQRATWASGSSVKWLLPSENEWYKAAFNHGTGASDYYLYPTSSNTAPTASLPTSTPNTVNFAAINGGGDYGSATPEPVGSYTGTTSPYGAFDMAGNVWEYTEKLVAEPYDHQRIGTSFGGTDFNTMLSTAADFSMNGGARSVGFRLISLGSAAAADCTWVGTTAPWGTADNWTPAGPPTGIATFNDTATGLTADISADVSPASVVFNNSTKALVVSGTKGIVGSATVLKQGTAKVTLSGVNSYSGVTTVETTGGTLQFNKAAAWNPVTNLGGANIKAGKMVFDYTSESSPAATIGALLKTSYNSASSTHFNTGKFQSTTADAHHALGWKDSANQVTVAYTLYGDATVNGAVDISDLSALGQNWNGTGKVWAQGDFNYDGNVDISDLSALGQHWNQSIAGFSGGEGGAIVPEPSTLALLAAGLVGLLAYAWRKRK